MPETRCAAWSRLAGVDPVGTAGWRSGYLLVDIDLPWPADIAGIDELDELVPLLGGSGLRLQARVPDGPRRVALHRFGHDGDAAMDGSSLLIGEGRGGLAAAVGDLLAGRGAPSPPERRELLICTHGRRDVCCGARGTTLHAELAERGEEGVDVRRTSHTGGHRFAATAILLPEATSWAYLDLDVVGAVLGRDRPFTEVAGCYRGWSGLANPRLQALERAVLVEEGWSLLDRSRWGSEEGDRAELTVADPDGRRRRWSAVVRPGRTVPRPECGAPADGARQQDVELVVDGLELRQGVPVAPPVG